MNINDAAARAVNYRKFAKASVEAGALIGAREFSEHARWPPEAVERGLASHGLFYLEIDGVRLFPTFYLDARFEAQDLEAVSKQLGSLSGGSKWQFFTTPKGSLRGLTPLEALLAGEISDVMGAAKGFAQRGASSDRKAGDGSRQ